MPSFAYFNERKFNYGMREKERSRIMAAQMDKLRDLLHTRRMETLQNARVRE